MFTYARLVASISVLVLASATAACSAPTADEPLTGTVSELKQAADEKCGCDSSQQGGGKDPGGKDPAGGGKAPGGKDPGGKDPGGKDPGAGGKDPGGKDPGGKDPGGKVPADDDCEDDNGGGGKTPPKGGDCSDCYDDDAPSKK